MSSWRPLLIPSMVVLLAALLTTSTAAQSDRAAVTCTTPPTGPVRIAAADRALPLPRIDGLPSQQVRTNVNSAIKNAVSTRVREVWHDIEGLGATPLLDLAYAVHLCDATILSVSVELGILSSQAAHGTVEIFTFVFDTRNGHRFRLKELFLPSSGHLSAIDRAIDAELRSERFPDTPTSPEHWVVRPEGLLVIFEPCRVTVCAAWVKRVLVPAQDLAPFVNASGPVASWRSWRPGSSAT